MARKRVGWLKQVIKSTGALNIGMCNFLFVTYHQFDQLHVSSPAAAVHNNPAAAGRRIAAARHSLAAAAVVRSALAARWRR